MELSQEKARAQDLGLPEGWLHRQHAKFERFIDPAGKIYSSCDKLRDVLGDQFPKVLVDQMKAASSLGLPEGWRIRRDTKRKNYVSPDGMVFQKLSQVGEFLGELPGGLKSGAKAVPDGLAGLLADALEAASSPQEAYVNIGLPAGWQVSAARRQRGSADLIFKTPTGRNLRGGKAFVEFYGEFPESMQEYVNSKMTPAAARETKTKAKKNKDETSGSAQQSKVEFEPFSGACESESRGSDDTHKHETFESVKKVKVELEPPFAACKRKKAKNDKDETSGSAKQSKVEFESPFGACESESRGSDDTDKHETFESVKKVKVELEPLFATCERKEAKNNKDETLESAKQGTVELEPLFGVRESESRGSDGTDKHETFESVKKIKLEVEPLSAAWESESRGVDDIDKRMGDLMDYTLQQSSDGISWNIIPHDVLCIDLDAIGRHIQVSGWECKMKDRHMHLFCNTEGCELSLHSNGNMVVQSAAKPQAEQIASSFVCHWLTVDG